MILSRSYIRDSQCSTQLADVWMETASGGFATLPHALSNSPRSISRLTTQTYLKHTRISPNNVWYGDHPVSLRFMW